jgi:glycosyltransferase involved in cell wall biosynthesis
MSLPPAQAVGQKNRPRDSGGCGRIDPLARPQPGLVSVVTVSFNSVRTIGRTIDSVVAQSYPMVEYIVIDGGSTDGTAELLRSREHDIHLWVSEPDRGISDAFNKGIALAAGEYLALVNSDDWLEPRQLAMAVAALGSSTADFVFGDLMLHVEDDRPSHVFRGDRDYARTIRFSMPHVNHPTVVCRRKVYDTNGMFDTTLRAAMDYEWLLRGYKAGVVGLYVPGIVGHMSMEGISNRDFSLGLREVRDTSVRYGYPSGLAQLRFLVRLFRGRARRWLLPLLPKGPYEWLRRHMNSHYQAIGS